MMKKITILLFVCMQSLFCSSQNLISNSSFEEFSTPEGFELYWNLFHNPIFFADGWLQGAETTDLINTDSVTFNEYYLTYNLLGYDSVYYLYENNISPFFPARTGVNFALNIAYGSVSEDKEFFGIELSETLIAGEEYCLSYYVKLGQGLVSGVDNLGAMFTSSIPSNLFTSSWLSFEPEIVSESGVPIIDSMNWTNLTGSFIADGTEKYIWFGIFAYNNELTIDTLGIHYIDMMNQWYTSAVYFYDDISLYKCGAVGEPANAGLSDCIVLGDSIQLGSHNYEDYYYEWTANGEVFSTEGMPWVSPDTTTIYGLHQKDFSFHETWSEVSIVVLQDPKDECVGLTIEEKINDGISVYPNPATDYIEINSIAEINSWKLIDALGKEVASSKYQESSKNLHLDVSTFKVGIYFLELDVEGVKVVKQVLVE